MLSHIYLHNFAIIETLDLELKTGMTALTGETGAGKSILIDAIGLVLGDRADSGVIRHGADKAEITLTVELEDTPSAQQWLKDQDLDADDHEQQCVLRRIIAINGKSRAWINGRPCNLGMLKQLGEQLVDIHGQHEHQSLMKRELQRQLIDDYAKHDSLLRQTADSFQRWKASHDALKQLSSQHSSHQATLDLLRFQTKEMDDLNLVEGEIDALDEEHSRLSNAGFLLEASSNSVSQLYDNDEQSIYSSLGEIIQTLDKTSALDDTLREPLELLKNSQIQIQEAADLLRRYHESIGHDSERLAWVEDRLSTLHDLSRKHQTTPALLFQKWKRLTAELKELDSDKYNIDALEKAAEEQKSIYTEYAQQLSESRQRACQKLSQGVTQAMQQLGMEGGEFSIHLEKNDTFSSHGLDHIEFQVSANPGQPLKSLIKVASGGELSRISLAIQMIAAQRVTLPALIFDEVDSGIGGGIAEVVGQQLRKLGENRQVLCVTHLPQVASKAHNHYQVTKSKDKTKTRTGMLILDDNQRIDEIARMMGGLEMTESTLSLAREMLSKQ